jgi:hypothetical protein
VSLTVAEGYVAKLDGTEAPFKGDLANTMVSVKPINDNTIEEADRRNGKTVQIVRFAVSADGKTMTISMEDQAKVSTRQFLAHKE